MIFEFEAMNAEGQVVRDVIEAANQDEAQAMIREMGFFTIEIAIKKPATNRYTDYEKAAFTNYRKFAKPESESLTPYQVFLIGIALIFWFKLISGEPIF